MQLSICNVKYDRISMVRNMETTVRWSAALKEGRRGPIN